MTGSSLTTKKPPNKNQAAFIVLRNLYLGEFSSSQLTTLLQQSELILF